MPDDFFRVRLVCVLLDACGMCFDKGSQKKKLDDFLTFFQVCSVLLGHFRIVFRRLTVLHLHQRGASHGCGVYALRFSRGTVAFILEQCIYLTGRINQAIRPKMTMLKNLEEAARAVDDLFNVGTEGTTRGLQIHGVYVFAAERVIQLLIDLTMLTIPIKREMMMIVATRAETTAEMIFAIMTRMSKRKSVHKIRR